ncbi:MAG TPA: hypothetical protein VN661_11790 [Candidatus Acidoferrales bacterium]|nr:hypothetical protein [Candidatus Acidoferrales bacterium]
MLNPANLFRLLTEFILLLLGALLIVLALSGHARLPSHPEALAIAGVILLYLAARSWSRPDPKIPRAETHIRAGSLLIVGALILAMAIFSRRHSLVLLAIAGGVLVLRGIAGAALAWCERPPSR